MNWTALRTAATGGGTSASVRRQDGTTRLILSTYMPQITPLAAITAEYVTGAWLHLVAPGLLGATAAITAGLVGTVGMYRFPPAPLREPTVRRWASIAVLLSGVWLAIAAAAGPGGLVFDALLIPGLALARPWWASHPFTGFTPPPAPKPIETDIDKMIHSARENALIQDWDTWVSCQGGPLPGTRLLDVTTLSDPERIQATIELPRGKMIVSQAISATERVVGALHRCIGEITIDEHPSEILSLAHLTVFPQNPLRETREFPGAGLFDLETGLLTVGWYADGAPVQVPLYDLDGAKNALVAGCPGSGKSEFISSVIASAVLSGRVTVLYGDPQQGMSGSLITRIVKWFAPGPDEIIRMLRSAVSMMKAREDIAAKMPWCEVTGEDGTITRYIGAEATAIPDGENVYRGVKVSKLIPSDGFPLIFIVIDEAHNLFSHRTLGPTAVKLVEDLTRMGRKVGMSVLLATQQPVATDFGNSTKIRNMLVSGWVAVFRTVGRFTGDVAFNGVMPVEPHLIPKKFRNPNGGKPLTAAGIGFVMGDIARAMMMRSYYLKDARHIRDARSADLDPATEAGAGSDYATRGERDPWEPVEEDKEAARAEAASLLPPAFLAAMSGLGSVDPAAPPAGEATVVTDLMRQTGDGVLTRAQIIQKTGKPERTVDYWLGQLTQQGHITRLGAGRYALTDTTDLGGDLEPQEGIMQC